MVTLLDGGTGRELKRIGAPFRQPEWSALALMEAPRYVRQVHQAFIDAGAEVISTNSYAVVPFHIGTQRFAADGARLAALAGQLARDAADGAAHAVRVAGSLPPVCGSYRAEWFDAGAAWPILTTLVNALRPYVDLWLAETLSSVEEARLVRSVLGDDPKHFWLSFTLSEQPGGRDLEDARLRSGQSIEAAVTAARELDARALLFNCSRPEVMGAAVSRARELDPTLPLGVYANAFTPTSAAPRANEDLNAIREDITPAGYLRWVDDWLARGASLVGGCCGIAPEHIRAIRDSLDSKPPRAAAEAG